MGTFMERVQQGLARARTETERQARILGLNNDIGQLEVTVRRRHQELGREVVQRVRDGSLQAPELDDLLQAIAADEERIRELRAQLSQV